MQWIKEGLLFTCQNIHPKLISHASNPLAIHIEGDIFRVFYSGRDARNRSSIGAVDINIVQKTILHTYNYPFFTHGPTDSYYADGVSIGNYYEVDGVKYILFMAWQAPEDKHWRGDIGRLIVNPDLTIELDSKQPFISTNDTDPISLSYPWVIKNHNDEYSMWYGSTKSWDTGNGEMLHTINYATSMDGHNWKRHGLSIPYTLGVAQAYSRPTVIYSALRGYEMWFSYRNGSGQKYRIGYATSEDLTSWHLALNESGIDVSDNGWDSEMIEYPYVFEHKGKHYMLYNGNGYGLSGFGLAIMKVE